MNMISTGAFLPEMDASNKQETMAEKFARVWEKKNSKVARAGGVSLMALSLAACGSSSDDTAATPTPTPTPTPDPEPTTPVVPAGETSTLTDEANTVIGTAGDDTINATTDTLNATDTIVDESATDSDTLNITATADVSVAPRLSGIENINVTATSVLASGDTTLNVNVADLGASSYTFDVNNADSLIAALAITNADSGSYTATGDFTDIDIATDTDADIVLTIGADAVIDTTGAADDLTIHGGGFDVDLNSSAATEDLVIDGAVDLVVDSMTALVGNANLTASNDIDAEVDAAEGNFTVTAGRDVTLASADAAEGDITVTAGRDISGVDAGAATGDVTITAGRDVAAIAVESAEGTVSVTAAGTITVATAAAADTVILDNTGATAGDTVKLDDATAATTVTITSVGDVDADEAGKMAATEVLTVTAARDSSIDADTTVAGSQVINLNANNEDGDAITFTLIADKVETINLGGSSEIIVAIPAADLSTETVTSTNTVGASLHKAAGSADVTAVAANVTTVLVADDAGNTITVDDDAVVALDTEQAQGGGGLTFDHKTAATTTTSTSFTMSIVDTDETDGAENATATGALNFDDIQTATIALGEATLDVDGGITGDAMTSLVITGSGDFDATGQTVTGDGTTRVVINAQDFSGDLDLLLDETADSVAVVNSGSGADKLTVDGYSTADDGFELNTGGGADEVVITTDGDAALLELAYNGGTGTDTLTLNANTTIAQNTVTLTSVEQIAIVGGGTTNVSSTLLSGNSFIISETGVGTATLTVDVHGTTVDLGGLAFASSFASGTDTIVVNASANAVSMNITGSSGDDTITGGSVADEISSGGGVDVITGGTGADVIDVGTDTDLDTVSYTATTDGGAAGVLGATAGDTITGFESGEDKINFKTAFETASMANSDTDAATAIAYAAGYDANNTDGAGNIDTILVFASGAATATKADLTTLADINSAVGTIANGAATDETILVINSGDGNAAIYLFTNDANAAAIEVGELQLLAMVDDNILTTDITIG